MDDITKNNLSIGLIGASNLMVIHFGINPIKGGSPPRDIRFRRVVFVEEAGNRRRMLSWEVEDFLSFVSDRNRGIEIMVYILKYVIVSHGATRIPLSIHARWAIEE